MKLVITGGGSGGHTLPAITIYDALSEYYINKSEKLECIYIGSHDGIEKEIAQKKNIPYYPIATGKLRRYFSTSNFTDLFRILKGIFSSKKILKQFKPQIVFSTGGFVSVPVVIASRMLKIPIVIHEQTVSVGLANKISSKFAQVIAISFLSSQKYFPQSKTIHTGQPIRKELFYGSKENCYKKFNLSKNLPIIYVTGGSQGSHKINQLFKELIPDLIHKANIIHQCGKTQGHNDFNELIHFKNSLPKDIQNQYIVKDFIHEDELKDILAGSSLLIGRAGAGTVNEAIALKIPSIFIPLAIATKNEQYENAKIMQSIGGADIVDESNITVELLKEKITSILFDPEKLNEMYNNLNAVSIDNATDKILNIIINTAINN
ncbi:MAG: undecaprenyldiphospho-muramoylpentapeptide beta-N-acetylglucosaminyltransferase [Spirochaetota bacterium]|nr:undecaprenyldiphospho-muramoylpentapeptide beta-N-acetylglucosaminyltransferase [Spirochaetota bacterium]